MVYFAASGRRFVMVHGFLKKTQKTPKAELKKLRSAWPTSSPPTPPPEMSSTEHSAPRHHPSWREVRDTFLADPDVHQAYQDLAPRFAVVRQLITLGNQRGWSQRELDDYSIL